MSEDESLDRALADLEMLAAAYPDETSSENSSSSSSSSFPLRVTLQLSQTATIQLELIQGYPVETGVQVVAYRSSPVEKVRMEEAVTAVRRTAAECLADDNGGTEGGFACCAAALGAWNDFEQARLSAVAVAESDAAAAYALQQQQAAPSRVFRWVSGEPLLDRKSSFQAHACRVSSDEDIRQALQQLMDSNSKLHRASHNMYAYRFTERLPDSETCILKHDNDDDGEDAAGSRLAHLLEMRAEDGVFVVVSRWFGGIKLGSRRFAHITNVAGQLLLHCHENEWKDM